jgi:hypothetical protein
MAPGDIISAYELCLVRLNIAQYQKPKVQRVLLALLEEGVLAFAPRTGQKAMIFERTVQQYGLLVTEGQIRTMGETERKNIIKEKREAVRRMCAGNIIPIYNLLMDVVQGHITYTTLDEDRKAVTVTETVSTEERIKTAKFLFNKILPDVKSVEIKGDADAPVKILFEVPKERLKAVEGSAGGIIDVS